jgi:uncharacterized protein
MPRPRRCRKIFGEPPIRCFKPDTKNKGQFEVIKINLDEFEAVRLRDYHQIQQKKAAMLMGISQPTFHRIINLSRQKIAQALVEGKIIKIIGGNYMTNEKRYKCRACGFEWHSPEKEYEKCPDCESEDIYTISLEEEIPKAMGQPGLGRRGGRGAGMGAGAPRVCKCPQCGYESEKTQGIPCRTVKCPKCGAPLCGAE